jgi:hypothetical protein
MKLGVLTLGAYGLIIVTSFWCISPFIGMENPSLSCLINVNLKSTLSEINIAIPAGFGGAIGLVNLLPAFCLSQCLSLLMRWVYVGNRLLDLPF